MRTELPEIHKEHFEAWLFSQPDEREWYFIKIDGCLICSFIKESTAFNRATVGSFYWRTGPQTECIQFPAWLELFQNHTEFGFLASRSCGAPIIARAAKECWRKLFPETELTLTPPRKEQATV